VIDGSSVTSSVMGMSDGPPFAASASPARGSRTPANTVIPRPAQSSAQAAPMPVEAPVTTTDMDGLVIWFIWLVCLVDLVHLVLLIGLVQPNKRNKPNQPNKPAKSTTTVRKRAASSDVTKN
jgi:hypothetical protein